MRTWLYTTLTQDAGLQSFLGGAGGIGSRVIPRESGSSINIPKPFLIYGLGTNTNEGLAEDTDHEAHRQFFQIWIHDEGGSFDNIDAMADVIKDLLTNASNPGAQVSMVRWLETSSEFSNETYNTLFRYLRFQAIISKGATL